MQEAPALEVLAQDISCQTCAKDYNQPTAPAQCMGRDLFELIAENKAQARERGDPEESAQGIEKDETPHGHAKDSRERRRRGVQAGYKFRDEQRMNAMSDEKILSAPNT